MNDMIFYSKVIYSNRLQCNSFNLLLFQCCMVEICGLDRQNGSFSPEALPGVLGTSFCTKVREKYYKFDEKNFKSNSNLVCPLLPVVGVLRLVLL